MQSTKEGGDAICLFHPLIPNMDALCSMTSATPGFFLVSTKLCGA
jgi:hypothetical protein